jgi:hypothetical protein
MHHCICWGQHSWWRETSNQILLAVPNCKDIVTAKSYQSPVKHDGWYWWCYDTLSLRSKEPKRVLN